MTFLKSEWVGQQIDTFPLLQWLGCNEAVDVFRTRLRDGGNAVLHLVAADPATAQDQLRNWQLATELDHPNLLRTFACGRSDIEGLDHLYLVTEVPEESLSEILPDRPLTADETREMLEPVIAALDYLHTRNLLLGCLEPANVLVAESRLKLSTISIRPVGSLRGFDENLRIYDAPESKSEPLSTAADLWSLGITLVEALTQKAPTWMRTSSRDPLIPVTVPQPFAEIARRCVNIDPAQRCTTQEIAAALHPHVPAPAQAPVQVSTQTPQPVPPQAPVSEPRQIALFEAPPQPVFAPAEELAGPAIADAPAEPSAKPFSRPMRTLEEEDEPHMPPRKYIGAAVASVVILLLLFAGWAAYRHKDKAAPPPPETASNAPAQSPTTSASSESAQPRPHGPTVKGEVTERVMPLDPARATRGIHGKVDVKIRVTVDHTGRVINANIESEGHSRYFAERGLEAARKWRFKAARVDGRPTSSTWNIRFEFRKDNTTASAVEVTP